MKLQIDGENCFKKQRNMRFIVFELHLYCISIDNVKKWWYYSNIKSKQ